MELQDLISKPLKQEFILIRQALKLCFIENCEKRASFKYSHYQLHKVSVLHFLQPAFPALVIETIFFVTNSYQYLYQEHLYSWYRLPSLETTNGKVDFAGLREQSLSKLTVRNEANCLQPHGRTRSGFIILWTQNISVAFCFVFYPRTITWVRNCWNRSWKTTSEVC